MTLSLKRRTIVAVLAAVLTLGGLAAGCDNEGGMYQGGGDSQPGWR